MSVGNPSQLRKIHLRINSIHSDDNVSFYRFKYQEVGQKHKQLKNTDRIHRLFARQISSTFHSSILSTHSHNTMHSYTLEIAWVVIDNQINIHYNFQEIR